MCMWPLGEGLGQKFSTQIIFYYNHAKMCPKLTIWDIVLIIINEGEPQQNVQFNVSEVHSSYLDVMGYKIIKPSQGTYSINLVQCSAQFNCLLEFKCMVVCLYIFCKSCATHSVVTKKIHLCKISQHSSHLNWSCLLFYLPRFRFQKCSISCN